MTSRRSEIVNLNSNYHQATEKFVKFGELLIDLIEVLLSDAGIKCHSIEFRVKTHESATRKLESNLSKYADGYDSLTDLLGIRIITYFPDQVDQVADVLREEFSVDEENSVDKRMILDADRFGYLSLHFILSMHEKRCPLREYADFTDVLFEVQIRSILQHAWAEIEHDLGYKGNRTLPYELQRRFSRLAGILEIADIEFTSLRDAIIEYDSKIVAKIGNSLADVELNQATLRVYLEQGQLVTDLDDEIVNILKAPGTSDNFENLTGMLTTALTHLGIYDIESLDSILQREQDNLIEFAKKHIELHPTLSQPEWEISPGGSIVYLIVMLTGSLPESEHETIVDLLSTSASRSSRRHALARLKETWKVLGKE